MDITRAFETLQTEVNVANDGDVKARGRRNLFRDALCPEPDVIEVFASGSVARGSQIDPIHDVDLVAVFDADEHPGWGVAGDSAYDCLAYVRDQVHRLIGKDASEPAEGEERVRLILIKNHSIKCFLDDPEETEHPFTVDVVPALHHNGHLLIPEQRNRIWVESDPKRLMRDVAKRHADWNEFVKLVRVLKRWNKDQKAGMKALAVEVLALKYMNEDTRSKALSQFFTSAAAHIYEPIEDPAELCGAIDPNMDIALAHEKLDAAASAAYHAVNAQGRGDTDQAACYWRKVFGDIFPEPEGGCSMIESGGIGTGLTIGIGGLEEIRRPVKQVDQG